MGSSRISVSGSVAGMPLVPPSQPTQPPARVAITGRIAVTRPPGDSSQPSSPCCTGSRLATAITGRSPAGASGAASPADDVVTWLLLPALAVANHRRGVARLTAGPSPATFAQARADCTSPGRYRQRRYIAA